MNAVELPEELLVDSRVAAPMCGLRPQTLAGWRCSGKADQPPFYRVGRNVRYRPSEVRAWVESRQRGPVAPGA